MQFGICVSTMVVYGCGHAYASRSHTLYVCVCKHIARTFGIIFVAVDGIASTSNNITLPAPFTDILNRVWNISNCDAAHTMYTHVLVLRCMCQRHVNYTHCRGMALFTVISCAYSMPFDVMLVQKGIRYPVGSGVYACVCAHH